MPSSLPKDEKRRDCKSWLRSCGAQSLLLFSSLFWCCGAVSQDFNECKAVVERVERLECLTRLSEQFQKTLDTKGETDLLTPLALKEQGRSWVFAIGGRLSHGMHLESHNDLNSGQYFGTALTAVAEVFHLDDLSYSVEIPWSRLTSTGIGDAGLRRLGRMKISGEFRLAEWRDHRIVGIAGVRPPLVDGADLDRVWQLSLGARLTGAWNSNYRWRVQSALVYDTEKLSSRAGPNGEEIGIFDQNPLLWRAELALARTWTVNSLELALTGTHSLIAGRTIITGDPSLPSVHEVSHKKPVQFTAVEIGYEFGSPRKFEREIRVWKSLENNWPFSLEANKDDPSETGALGIGTEVRYFF